MIIAYHLWGSHDPWISSDTHNPPCCIIIIFQIFSLSISTWNHHNFSNFFTVHFHLTLVALFTETFYLYFSILTLLATEFACGVHAKLVICVVSSVNFLSVFSCTHVICLEGVLGAGFHHIWTDVVICDWHVLACDCPTFKVMYFGVVITGSRWCTNYSLDASTFERFTNWLSSSKWLLSICM